jgi:hypothetical protein
VLVHWQPETGAVREYNHFSVIKVYILIHGYRLTFRGGFQLISHIFNFETFLNYLETFLIIGPYLSTFLFLITILN